MLSKKIGIDLGTATVLVYVKGEGIVVNEPSPSTLNGDGSRVLAVGREAMLQRLIRRVLGRQRIFKPEIMICVSSAVTSMERRAVTEAVIAAGARQAWLIDEPIAAAIGAGLSIAEPRANAVCNIGAGTSEIAVISMSGIVAGRSLPVAGNRIDHAIAEHLKREHHAPIDRRTAEEVKIAIGSAISMEEPLVTEVRGHSISSNDLTEAIQAPLRVIVAAVREVIDEVPKELAADVFDRGLVLTGGGARLRGLAGYMAQQTGIPVVVAEEPQTAAVRGTGMALDQFEVLKRNHSYLR